MESQRIRTAWMFLLLAVATAGVAAERAAGTLERLVFVGDSITCGVGVKNRSADRFSAVATRLLKDKFPQVKEINLGKSGNALCQQPPNRSNLGLISAGCGASR